MIAAGIAIIIYILGYMLSYSMQKIEHIAEGEVYSKGDRLLNMCLSLLSIVMVLIIVTRAWLSKIAALGYWKKPAKETVTITQPQPE